MELFLSSPMAGVADRETESMDAILMGQVDSLRAPMRTTTEPKQEGEAT